MCAATNCCESDCPAVTIDLNKQNLTDFISNSLTSNVNPCDYFDLSRLNNSTKKDSCYLFLHLNISSLQAHFDDLFDFLSQLDQPPSIVFISETRINIEPSTNITVIPCYTFIHCSSPTKSGGVGA